jgi:hypothetical protein
MHFVSNRIVQRQYQCMLQLHCNAHGRSVGWLVGWCWVVLIDLPCDSGSEDLLQLVCYAIIQVPSAGAYYQCRFMVDFMLENYAMREVSWRD